MKNTIKVLGIIALAAVIGFSMAGCKNDADDDGLPAPTGLRATLSSSNDLSVNWNSVSGASGYTLYLRVKLGGESSGWEPVDMMSLTDLNINVSEYIGYTFEFKVAAYNAYGTEGKMSNVVRITVPGNSSSSLPAPTGLTATAYSPSDIILTWNAVLGAKGYRVYASGSSSSGFIPSTITQKTAEQAGGGQPATIYYFKVAAINANGTEGTMSSVVSARTLSVGTYSLNGTWACKEYRGMQINVRNNTTGYFYSLPTYDLIPSYVSAVSKGLIKVGDERWKNIKTTGTLTFSAEEKLVTSQNDVATGTPWGPVTFTLSADGQTLTMYNSVNQTGTRIVWTRQ